MNKEKLFTHLDRRYSSKRDMVSRIPLGIQLETLWCELLDRRRSRSIILSLYSHNGIPYWYVNTDKMVAASEKIIEELYENDTEFDPYIGVSSVATLEEVFYTSYVEGAQITMQAAMEFLTSGLPPRDIEEQLIANNRQAGSYAAGNLYRNIDADFLKELAYILTDGMDNGGQEFRTKDEADFISPEGETYKFPSAHLIPERVNDLCTFLASGETHPLIKAAAAQAYILILRPFPEGNERLSRILSSMILLRAGYTFLIDVSLSALIAKRSYAYFEAAANIMREENGGDLTYFVEYFLELLSRAVDERKLRIRQREERDRQTERELARTTLIPSSEPVNHAMTLSRTKPSLSTALEQTNHSETAEPIRSDQPGEGDSYNDFFMAERDDETAAVEKEICLELVRDRLYGYLEICGDICKKVIETLFAFIENGTDYFTSEDIRTYSGAPKKRVTNIICKLKEKDIIENSGKKTDRHILYRFSSKLEPLTPQYYEAEIIEIIKRLQNSDSTTRERRISEIITRCIQKGIITATDYDNLCEADKLRGDMNILERMGIVTKITDRVYRINRKRTSENLALTFRDKYILKVLYETFKGEEFTKAAAADTLNIAPNSVGNILYMFVLLRIAGCREVPTRVYRLLVNPKDQPSLFNNDEFEKVETVNDADFAETENLPLTRVYSKGVYDLLDRLDSSMMSIGDRRIGSSIRRCLPKGKILQSDYLKWGYTKCMWHNDLTLAKQLGLVSMIKRGCYALNKELSPVSSELTLTQKKKITAIYEVFGDQKFSLEMCIAALNCSGTHSWAMLHKLTLIKVLDQKTTEKGKRYQLLVNPNENPEYFDIAA